MDQHFWLLQPLFYDWVFAFSPALLSFWLLSLAFGYIVIISISDDGYYNIEGSFSSYTIYSFLIANVTLLTFVDSTSTRMLNIRLALVNISRGIGDSLVIIYILIGEIMERLIYILSTTSQKYANSSAKLIHKYA